jgi:hypothetical protein
MSPMRQTTLRGSLLVVLLVLAGCGSVSTPAVSVAVTPSSEPPSPSAVPSVASPTLHPQASLAPCGDPRLCTGSVPEGPAEIVVAGRDVRFGVGPGWSAYVAPGGAGFQLVRESADLEGFSANLYDGEVFSNPCSGTDVETIGPGPEDFVDFLAARDGVSVRAAATNVPVGNDTAIQLDVEVVATEACPESPNFLIRSGPNGGDFHLSVGELARVLALGAGDRSIVLVFESSSQAGYDELLQLSGPILQSMMID